MANSKAMGKTMFEDFQVKGFWWLPEKEEHVPGILFYKQDKIELELMGTLESNERMFMEPTNQDIVWGRSDKGEEFTLFSAYSNGVSASFPGYATESYQVNSFLVGGHFHQMNDIQFSYCSFAPTYLSTWFKRNVFLQETTYDQTDHFVRDRKITYTRPSAFKYYIPSINSHIEEGHLTKFSGVLHEEINWSSKSILYITPEHSQSMEWFKENIFSLRELLILFIGSTVYFEQIEFIGKEEIREGNSETYRPRYKYFQSQDKSKFKPEFKEKDILVKFSHIEENFNNILNSWFEKRNTLDTVRTLYFTDYYIEKDYLHKTFLNTIQILEIYHRHVYEGKLFEEDYYNQNVAQLINYAKSSLPEDFVQTIEKKLKHGNEYSLNKRLKEIINSLEKDSKLSLIGNSDNRDRFIQQLVDTRNYLTHYDKSEKKKLLETTLEKFYAIQRLKAIATLIIVKELGVKESLMLEVLENNSRYKFVLNKAKEFLNKKPKVNQ